MFNFIPVSRIGWSPQRDSEKNFFSFMSSLILNNAFFTGPEAWVEEAEKGATSFELTLWVSCHDSCWSFHLMSTSQHLYLALVFLGLTGCSTFSAKPKRCGQPTWGKQYEFHWVHVRSEAWCDGEIAPRSVRFLVYVWTCQQKNFSTFHEIHILSSFLVEINILHWKHKTQNQF